MLKTCMVATALSVGFSFWVFLMTLVIAVSFGLYFLPTIVAVLAHRRNAVLVAIVNTLLGWSFVGWIVALVMAVTKEPQPVIVVNQQLPRASVTYEDASYRTVPGTSIEPKRGV